MPAIVECPALDCTLKRTREATRTRSQVCITLAVTIVEDQPAGNGAAALVARVIDSDDVLRTLEGPVLMTHGRSDTVILPAMGDQILKTCRTSTASWYPETGHAPFLEDPSRFNRELADFAREAKGS
jgi:pimeloyl-ACP methyl ester carboxylesterase